MTLEAGLYEDPRPAAPAPLLDFANNVETTLWALGQALRDPAYALDHLPDLRADQRALADLQTSSRPGRDAAPDLAGFRHAILVSETDRMTNSLTTMTRVLRR